MLEVAMQADHSANFLLLEGLDTSLRLRNPAADRVSATLELGRKHDPPAREDPRSSKGRSVLNQVCTSSAGAYGEVVMNNARAAVSPPSAMAFLVF